MTHNPFLVPCPPSGGCGVAAGVRCRIGNPRISNDDGQAVHAARMDAARIRTATHGTCTRCGRLMLQLTGPDETRHAYADAEGSIPRCPPMSMEPGVREWTPSGADQFVRADVQPAPPPDQPNPPPAPTYDPLPPICPECLAGKCGNCNGQAWDHAADEPAACACTEEVHGG